MNLDLNLQAVKDFGLDVWEDLGRTRLAGLAVGLALALLAITAVTLRPGGEPAAATGTEIITPSVTENEIDYTVPGDEPLSIKDVDLSSPRDPFRSLDGLASSGGDQTLLAAGEDVIDAVMSSGSTGGGLSVDDGASTLMPLDDLSSGGTTPTVAPTDPNADFNDADEPASEPAPTPVTDYSYTADIQFGLVDDLQRYSSVQRLGLVPSRRLPLIMYLGTTSDQETAVFMVDSRLSQGGEGRCVPKDSLCTFLELRAEPAHDEHHFRDADGNEYLLRLRGLNRRTASAGSLGGRDVSALRDSPAVVDGQR